MQECMESILNQNYSNIEIICVEDASIDNTLQILYKLQLHDKRIIVIENEHRMGAAYCRNKGLEVASGYYSIFLDSDDKFEPTMIDSAVKCADVNNVDLVFFDYKVVEIMTESNKEHVYSQTTYANSRYSENVFNCESIKDLDFLTFSTAPWNKLYRTEFLKRKKITFQAISSSNDVVFSLLSYLEAGRMKIVQTERPLLSTYIHSGTDRISNNRSPYNEYLAIRKVFNEANKRGYNYKGIKLLFIKGFELLISQFKRGEGNGEYYTFLKTEGVDELYRCGGWKLSKVSALYNHPLNLFKLYEYEDRWFDYFYFDFLDRTNRIWKIWTNEKRVLLWGLGQYGKRIVCSAFFNKKNIDILLDYDNCKKGTFFLGKQIEDRSIRSIENVDLIIVGFLNITEEIKSDLRKTNIETIYIQDFINS